MAVPVKGNVMGLEESWKCDHLCDLVKVSTAEVMAVYGTDFYQGMPALTRNVYGKGAAYYVCADFEQGFYDDVYSKIVQEAEVKGAFEDIPEGVEVTSRYSQEFQYIFVQNFNRHSVEIPLPVDEMEIILGDYNNGIISSFETVVLKVKNK